MLKSVCLGQSPFWTGRNYQIRSQGTSHIESAKALIHQVDRRAGVPHGKWLWQVTKEEDLGDKTKWIDLNTAGGRRWQGKVWFMPKHFHLVAAHSVFCQGVLSFSNCVQLFPLGKLLPASGNILLYDSVIFRLHHQGWGRRCVCHVSFAQLQSRSGAASTCADPLWAVDWAAALEEHHIFLTIAATGVERMGTSPGGDVSESFHKSQDLVLLLHIISD